MRHSWVMISFHLYVGMAIGHINMAQVHPKKSHLLEDPQSERQGRQSKYLVTGPFFDSILLLLHIAVALYALNADKSYLDERCTLFIYYSLMYSHLSRVILLWGKSSKVILNKLTVQQKKAIRVIMKSKYNEHTDPLFCGVCRSLGLGSRVGSCLGGFWLSHACASASFIRTHSQ